MIETTNPEIDVEELMRHIREDLARRKQSLTTPSLAETTQRLMALKAALEQGWPALPTCDLQPAFVPSPERRYTLGELLRFHDDAFVANAYQAILLRPADPGGLEHYLDLLRRGESKVGILGRLRYSPEGRQHGVKIKGLGRGFLLWRFYHLPLIGGLFQTLAILARLPALERNQRCFEAYAIQQIGRLNLRTGENANITQHAVQQRWTSFQAALPPLQRLLTELATGKADAAALQGLADSLGHETQEQLAKVAEHLRCLEERNPMREMETLTGQVRELREIKADGAALETLATRWRAGEQQFRNDMDVQLRLLNEHKADAAQLTGLANHLMEMAQTKADQTALSELRDTLAQAVQAKADQTSVASMAAEMRQVQQRIQDHKRSLLDQQRRLGLLLEEARKRLPDPLDKGQLATFAGEADHLLDAMYVTFEDRFRGDRADIKQRMTVYLPLIAAARVGTPDAPIVDIGCGRGEWLELLQEHGLTARGVDLNRIMIDECRERGCEVAEAEALQYLRELPDNSLGAVTGMHIIEHLPLPVLIALLDESLRVLRPGGLAIFETPNPENLMVGACNFYMDPTHRNPLPPVMVEYLVEARGFVRVEIRRWQQGLQDSLQFLQAGTPGAAELNPLIQMAKEHYFAAPDYAVIGYKAC
ncbi:MAG: methyltransferase domain-containing protein [Candidatus Competibacter sp.]|nr:methyltransferase domain-containing protein [Candidatus Competibacter sp.]